MFLNYAWSSCKQNVLFSGASKNKCGVKIIHTEYVKNEKLACAIRFSCDAPCWSKPSLFVGIKLKFRETMIGGIYLSHMYGALLDFLCLLQHRLKARKFTAMGCWILPSSSPLQWTRSAAVSIPAIIDSINCTMWITVIYITSAIYICPA